MNSQKIILSVLLLSLALTSCGQTKTTDTKRDSYKVLAKLISFDGGDKIHFAKFSIIKDLSGTLMSNDTIVVGYYNYKQPDHNIDQVLLTLKKYDGQTIMNDYFICPDYDGKTGIQKAKIEFIDFDYWEVCETGKGDCKPLTFTRTKTEKNWFLIMPCGGTETTLTISGKNFSENMHLLQDNCPPYLALASLPDGQYAATMSACGLGGTVIFNLTTK